MKSMLECLRLVQNSVMRTPPNKQFLVNGLAGVALGANNLNDRRLNELVSEFIENCLKLLKI